MKKRRGKRLFVLLLLVCIGVLIIRGCGNSGSSQKENNGEMQSDNELVGQLTVPASNIGSISSETESSLDIECDEITDKTADGDLTSTDMSADTEETLSDGREESRDSDSIRPEFKEALDSYEVFFDEYIEFMEKYAKSDSTIEMLADYADYMMQYADMMKKLEALGDDDLSTAEAAYYLEVMARIEQKLLRVAM